jgi:hypothetical protein
MPRLTDGSGTTNRHGSGASMHEARYARLEHRQNAGSPVALIAPSVNPWYARIREMTLVLSGRPSAFQ